MIGTIYSYIIWSCIISNSRERDKINKIKILRHHFILEQYKIKNNCILAKRNINRLLGNHRLVLGCLGNKMPQTEYGFVSRAGS